MTTPQRKTAPASDEGRSPGIVSQHVAPSSIADTPAPYPDRDAKVVAFEAWLSGKPTQPPRFSDRLRAAGLIADTPRPGGGTARPVNPTNADQAYAISTLNRLAGEVAMTPEGERNETLNKHALRAYRVADGCGLDRQTVTDTMEDAASRCGLTDSEIKGTLDSARNGSDKYGPAHRDPGDTQVNATDFGPDVGHLDTTGDSQDAGTPALTARLLNRTALKALPDPEPLIANTLDQGTVALLYGKWGTCKSFIAFDFAASVATGRAWQGRNTERRRALYVAAEGAFGFKARAAAWEAGWHTTIGDDDLGILPCPVNLTHRAEVNELAAVIAHGGYGFVVFDTLSRCMVGADENSAKDCGLVVDSLTRLRECTPGGRGVVLGVHHTGKDGKTFRGSSVFEAGADTVYAVTADCGLVSLSREKRKDGPEADNHELRLDLVDGTGSGVISVHRGVNKTGRADRLLSTFVRDFAATGATKAELRAASEMDPGTFYRAVNDLLQSGDLINEGTEKRPFYKAGERA